MARAMLLRPHVYHDVYVRELAVVDGDGDGSERHWWRAMGAPSVRMGHQAGEAVRVGHGLHGDPERASFFSPGQCMSGFSFGKRRMLAPAARLLFFCGAQASSERTVSNVMRLRMHNALLHWFPAGRSLGFLPRVFRHSVAVISSMQC